MASRSARWLLGMLLLIGCGDQANNGREQSLDPQTRFDETRFDGVIDAFLAEHKLAGATAVVVEKSAGVLHERGYGELERERVSLIASSSKILSAGVLVALADQGLLDLDAPVSKYLGGWGEHKSDITVAMLLSNSSGLVSLTEDPLYAPYLCQYIDAGKLTSCAQSIYTAADAADRRSPDTMFAYGGGQWQLAGGVAEVVSGKSWAQLIQELYVAPCELDTLGYTNQFARARSQGNGTGLDYPSFFDGDVSVLPKTDNPSIEGGAYVTAGDYGKLLLMHLRGGLCGDARVLSQEGVARMQRDRIGEVYQGTTGSPRLAGYGLGWWVDREHQGVVVDPGAYGAIAWLDNKRGYGVFVILEAGAGSGDQLRQRLMPALEEMFVAR